MFQDRTNHQHQFIPKGINIDFLFCLNIQMTSQTFMMQVASSICYTPCVITTTAVPPQMPPLAFSLTADSSASFLPAGAGAGTNFNQCANTDYLVIHGAVDSTMPTSFNDRFCGNNLNPASQTTSVTLCCK